MPLATSSNLVVQIAERNPGRSEADLQSLIAEYLRSSNFGLMDVDIKLESPAPGRRRIDIETGQTVIEVKKDLKPGKVYSDAVTQINEYVALKSQQLGCRYVGILTDGKVWQCFHLLPTGEGVLVSECTLDIKLEGLVISDQLHIWLGSVLATEQQIYPLPEKVEERLGSTSPSQRLDFAYLQDLWREVENQNQVILKRNLWSKLLKTALGNAFSDDTELFLNHTYLVLVANIISHEILGLNAKTITADDLLSGERFSDAGVFGAIEADFFSWILESTHGEDFIKEIVRKVTMFQWSGAAHDVLKHLYESVIDPKTRKQLGEYYTPDWLALAIVDKCVSNPLEQRVLDPSCGSGTFLFHTVRKYLNAADEAGIDNREALNNLTKLVIGIDLHPVATALARTTYLLAIGPKRLKADRDDIIIPVYLGDSLQWQTDKTVITASNIGLCIDINDDGGLFQEQLSFPESIMLQPEQFNQLIIELQNKAIDRTKGSTVPSIQNLIKNYGLNNLDSNTILQTFTLMCTLHDQNRNHIWGYYIRNLVRPLWLSRPDGQVDVLIGNPPWLSYRFMTREMKDTFKIRSIALKLWIGGKHATQQDLSTFFIVTAADQFLKIGGKVGFVVPNSVLSREVYEPFRKGRFNRVSLNLTQAWDLDEVRPHIFPVPGGVIFGTKIDPTDNMSASLGNEVIKWTGKISNKEKLTSEEIISSLLKQPTILRRVSETLKEKSLYRGRFSQGATIVPSVLHRVEQNEQLGQLGRKSGTVSVKSLRSSLEKEPWKSVPSRNKSIETRFVMNLYTGSSIVPFRVMASGLAVIPWDGNSLISLNTESMNKFPLMANWWKDADDLWNKHSRNNKMTLLNRINYQKSLENQFPLAPIRVVYNTSGQYLTAAMIKDQKGIVESRLYWATCQTDDEAYYLLAILNSPIMTTRVSPFQSKGNFGARDFHLHVWNIAVPEFKNENLLHFELSQKGREGAQKVASLNLVSNSDFKKLRGEVRKNLRESGFFDKTDELVRKLLK